MAGTTKKIDRYLMDSYFYQDLILIFFLFISWIRSAYPGTLANVEGGSFDT